MSLLRILESDGGVIVAVSVVGYLLFSDLFDQLIANLTVQGKVLWLITFVIILLIYKGGSNE